MRLRFLAFTICTVAGVALASPVIAAAATLTVNTTKDVLVPGPGKCSLREAIEAVDVPSRRTTCGAAGGRSNSLVLAPGRYALSIPPAGADDNTSGDLNVTTTTPLTITTEGTRGAVLDGGSLGDRVLTVERGATVTLNGLTITGGHAAAGTSGTVDAGCAAGADGLNAGAGGNGGGIANLGTLLLEMVTVTGNTAGAGGAGGNGAGAGCGGGNGGQGGDGGGIYSQGRLSVTDSTIYANHSGAGGVGGRGDSSTIVPGADGTGGQGGFGGGIYSTASALTVTNSTLFGNFAGAGGAGGGVAGTGGAGGSGGAVAVVGGPSELRSVTVADDGIGAGGAHGATGGLPGADGLGGGVFVQSADGMRLQNTIVASTLGTGCDGSAVANGGGDLSYGATGCPGRHGNPKLGPLKDNGGSTETMALGRGSAAIDGVPRRGGDCPAADQRGVRRPQGRACDIGAYEFALPTITVTTPAPNGSYEFGSRIRARFGCDEGGVASAIARCTGSVAPGHGIGTRRDGSARFVVTAVDKDGNRATRTIHYDVWLYVNPLARVTALMPRRIDLGVDYGGYGPLLAIGRGRVTFASNTDSGPSSCWAISCWPGGGIVVYQFLEGPYAGKYTYVAEHITVNVHAGQIVSPGQRIATLYLNYPWSEWGWAAGPGPEAMAMADGHYCHTCPDVGDWSTAEGRNMNHLLVGLGAPSGLFQPIPNQSMPPGWPTWP
jgi:CSLREA domain-containing protein